MLTWLSGAENTRCEILDEDISRRIKMLCAALPPDMENQLRRLLSDGTGGERTVRAARDGLSVLLKEVRNGNPQIIGRTHNCVVVISLRDLTSLLYMAKDLSFGEALEAMELRS